MIQITKPVLACSAVFVFGIGLLAGQLIRVDVATLGLGEVQCNYFGIKNETIRAPPIIYHEFQEMWRSSQLEGVEKGLCVEIINNRIISTSPADVKHEKNSSLRLNANCATNLLHTHPNYSCRPSIARYDVEDNKLNGDVMYLEDSGNEYIGIMCGEDNVLFYKLDDIYNGYRVVEEIA